jgi:hypothetical protein
MRSRRWRAETMPGTYRQRRRIGPWDWREQAQRPATHQARGAFGASAQRNGPVSTRALTGPAPACKEVGGEGGASNVTGPGWAGMMPQGFCAHSPRCICPAPALPVAMAPGAQKSSLIGSCKHTSRTRSHTPGHTRSHTSTRGRTHRGPRPTLSSQPPPPPPPRGGAPPLRGNPAHGGTLCPRYL